MVSMQELDGRFTNLTYNQKGGHLKRSRWHRAINKLLRRQEQPKIQSRDNKRKMPRMPRDGKQQKRQG
ncbi:MAG: hypothetical protein ACD_19C00293G0001 [uncultured bacterium]|nr:MAG: hypothetical protein ACD_19C00293G0001 [uncultured bacterium]